MHPKDLPPLPLPAEKWHALAQELELSPRHKRIVELILRNRCDKQIVADLGIAHSTLRTHITRIFGRLGVSDRVELVLLLFSLSHGIRRHQD
jgi:DNA-binding NarL/FixJ family response regulator